MQRSVYLYFHVQANAFVFKAYVGSCCGVENEKQKKHRCFLFYNAAFLHAYLCDAQLGAFCLSNTFRLSFIFCSAMDPTPPAKHFCLDCNIAFADNWKMQRHQSSARHKTLASCRVRTIAGASSQSVALHPVSDQSQSSSSTSFCSDQYAFSSTLELGVYL